MIKFTETEGNYPEIWRVFISGSSSAGKTYFAKQLLENNFFKYERVYFYHPDIAEDFPVKWELEKPVLFQAGLPSRQELMETKAHSCVIIDDLYTEACQSSLISYLFRVLSSKKKIHVIIMTQRYYAEGSKGLNIRNSSNFHVLMNNVDVRTNQNVGTQMGLRKEFALAAEFNKNVLYPYIFLDRTNEARCRNLQVYTEIFSRYKQVVYNRMKCYIVSEADFKAYFDIVDSNLAVKNENAKSKANSVEPSTEEETTSESSNSSEEFTSSSDESNTSSEEHIGRRYRADTSLTRYKRKRDTGRKTKRALYKHKKHSKL